MFEKWTTDENSCWTCIVCYSEARIWPGLIRGFKANCPCSVYRASEPSGLCDKRSKGWRHWESGLGRECFDLFLKYFLKAKVYQKEVSSKKKNLSENQLVFQNSIHSTHPLSCPHLRENISEKCFEWNRKLCACVCECVCVCKVEINYIALSIALRNHLATKALVSVLDGTPYLPPPNSALVAGSQPIPNTPRILL